MDFKLGQDDEMATSFQRFSFFNYMPGKKDIVLDVLEIRRVSIIG